MTVESKTSKPTLLDLTAALIEAKEQKQEAENVVEDLARNVRHLEAAIIQTMKEGGMDAVAQHGFNFSVSSKLSAKRTDDDVFFDWCEATGYGACIKRTIHHATQSKLVGDAIEQTGEVPVGVEVSYFDVLSQRKKGR